jgi:hypothetical protein
MRYLLALAVVCLLCPRAIRAEELPEVVVEDFEQGAERWQATDAKAWEVLPGKDGQGFGNTKQSEYQPPHRSPLNIALLKDVAVGDFVLEADVRSTVKDYGHRSMCMFFGYQDPANFYYVHFGKQMDDHANQIFIVDDAPRTKISTKTTDGTPWDDAWHHVKIVRTVQDGAIAIYFDDMETPVMTATDKTFASGQIGLGTFDDAGIWDNVVLRGTVVEAERK